MMETSTIPANLLSPRLDAEYYSPEVLPLVKSLYDKGHPVLGRLLASMKRHPMCYGFEQWEDSAVGRIPYFKGEDLYELSLKHGNSFIREAHFDEYPSAQVRFGEMIMSVRGTIGRVSVCRNSRGLCSPNTIVLVPKPELDSEFCATFLSCRQGQILINREVSGTVQDTITEDAIANIQAIKYSAKTQTYIGEKVRQAESLRDHARELKGHIAEIVALADLVAASQSPDPKTNRVQSCDLSDRLDSKYYGLRAMSVERAARNLHGVALSSLGPEVSNGFESREFVEHGRAYVTVSEVSSGRLSLESAPQIPLDVEIPEKATLTSTCVLVVRTGSIGIAVKPHAEDTKAVISSHLIKLEFQSEDIAASVAALLSSEAGVILQRKISYGAVQPQIGQEELLRLPIPQPILQQGSILSSLMNDCEASVRSAERLTTAAKSLVEALIEGKVSEPEIVAAQEALERSDNSTDRALLRRLTHRGLDVPGQPPLFPDLDALYALLAQTAPATE